MSKNNGCVGSYSVSGYTRSDGTEVSGYTRTCSAAHSSNKSSGTSTPKLDDEEKMKRRADILYGSDEEYVKKYYGANQDTNLIKRLQNRELYNLNDKIQEKAKQIELIKSNNYHFSDEEIVKARKFIQGEEKFVAEAYKPNKHDVWTIGYGHTGKVDGKAITSGMKITKEKAEELYRKDFEAHIKPLREIEVPLTSNQKIALASFSFNLGPDCLRNSSIFKNLQKGDYKEAAEIFDLYVKQKNKDTGKYEVLEGLVKRRKREKKLFLTLDGE